jgi:hypothetical protein
MSQVSGPKSGLTFQEIAARLPKNKLKRLVEIKKAYPHIPLEKLPAGVKHEAEDILQSVINPPPAGRGTPGQIRGGVQATPDYSKLFSVIGTDLANNKDVVICQKDRTKGLYVIGITGTGKSTLLANLILSDINQGLGSALLSRIAI